MYSGDRTSRPRDSFHSGAALGLHKGSETRTQISWSRELQKHEFDFRQGANPRSKLSIKWLNGTENYPNEWRPECAREGAGVNV